MTRKGTPDIPIKRKQWFERLYPGLLYLLITSLTQGRYFADTKEYVDSLIAKSAGYNLDFIEFGHVLWRPLGLVTYTVLRPLLPMLAGEGIRRSAFVMLYALGLGCGLGHRLYLLFHTSAPTD